MSQDKTATDIEAFAARAKSALAGYDSAPAEITAFAKLAFEFDDIALLDDSVIDDGAEFAGVRGLGSDFLGAASSDGISLTWGVSGDQIVGVIVGDAPTLAVQSFDARDPEALAVIDGKFKFPLPTRPYRLIVEDVARRWATRWVS